MLENLEKYRNKPAHIIISEKHLKYLGFYDSKEGNKGVQTILRSANEAGILVDAFTSYEDYIDYRKVAANLDAPASKRDVGYYSNPQFFPWHVIISIEF